jgi:hypothetical protein
MSAVATCTPSYGQLPIQSRKSVFRLRCTFELAPDILRAMGERSTNTYFYNLQTGEMRMLDLENSVSRIIEVSPNRIVALKQFRSGQQFVDTLNPVTLQFYWERRVSGVKIEGARSRCVEENIE